ncbi:MAG: nucleoside triphosphate pyrophosphohydrolase [Actinobacteria bacterium]|nr:nucleoside triphosphate pyrophosphohydrolase [Actinomycetota bacterium]
MSDGLATALLDLQHLTERLRRECPWDREQTARTIVPHTLEEAYEVADAAFGDSPDKLVDELGDLLFQVYFLALLLDEQGHGGLEDVARKIHAKLVTRHPHVFGAAAAETPDQVRQNWEHIKRTVELRAGIFHDVPTTLPALMQARKVQRRAAAVGFEYPDVAGALADLEDELRELEEELEGRADPPPERPPDERQAAEIGDVLFACVNVARRLNVDPELELRRATERFAARVDRAAELADGAGLRFADLTLSDQDRFYDLAKEAE